MMKAMSVFVVVALGVAGPSVRAQDCLNVVEVAAFSFFSPVFVFVIMTPGWVMSSVPMRLTS